VSIRIEETVMDQRTKPAPRIAGAFSTHALGGRELDLAVRVAAAP